MQPASSHVEGDAAQPGAEAVGGAEPAQAHEGDDGGLLDDVAGKVVVAKHAGRQGGGDVAMATHQLGEGRLVAGARGSHQLGVGPWLAPLEAGHAP